jgi:Uma2 family endonuclease
MATPSRKPATFVDLMARPNHDRLEIIGGELVEKAMPSPAHAAAELELAAAIAPFNRRPGGRDPGGWWLFTEIHVEYPRGEIYCHDAAGWRRDRVPERPSEWPVRTRPDWVCEIVSPRHEKQDMVDKPRVLHAAEVPHYWVVDPEEQILLVHRWSRDGYIVVQRAAASETIRAEPFEAIELHVGLLFGQDRED